MGFVSTIAQGAGHLDERAGRVIAGFAAVALVGLGAVFIAGPTDAKSPGSTYCFYGKCHRVKSLTETEALVGTDATLSASFYDSCHRDPLNPCGLTSSGEKFRPEAADNAASPIYPDGTKLLVWSPETKAAVILRINNAGPYWGDRKLDLSRGAADVLGVKDQGVGKVKVRVIDAPSAAEATYSKNRNYDPVPGPIGFYETFEEANVAMAQLFALEALSAAVKTSVTQDAIVTARADIVQPRSAVMVASAKPADRRKPARAAVASSTVTIPVIKELVAFADAVFLGATGSSSQKGAPSVAAKPQPALALSREQVALAEPVAAKPAAVAQPRRRVAAYQPPKRVAQVKTKVKRTQVAAAKPAPAPKPKYASNIAGPPIDISMLARRPG